MIRRKGVYLVLVLLMMIAIASCSRVGNPCYEPLNVTLRMGCYLPSDTGSAGVRYELPKAYVVAIDAADSSAIGYFATKANAFDITFSPLQDSCRWYIQPDSANSLYDTLTFYYSRQLKFLSNACGYTYHYNLGSVRFTDNNIDSIVINNRDINGKADIEHVKVFF